MRAGLLASLTVVAALAGGCTCNSFERDAGPAEVDSGMDACALCEPCDDAIQLRVDVGAARPEDVMVSGATLTCEPAGGLVYCFARDVPAGMYELTIMAPGFMDEMIFFEIDPPLNPDDCCSCPSTFSRLITLRPE